MTFTEEKYEVPASKSKDYPCSKCQSERHSESTIWTEHTMVASQTPGTWRLTCSKCGKESTAAADSKLWTAIEV
jgi:transcription elongation factor Elf1